MSNAPASSPRRWPLWMLLLAAGAVVGISGGLRQVVGVYMPPVTATLGIVIEPFSTSLALASLLWGIGSIGAGALADRYGTGIVAGAGIVLMAVGYYVIYAATGASDLIWSGVWTGIGAGCTGMSIMVGAIGRAASPEQRTTAIAVLGIAGGIGGFVVYPYSHLFIEWLGWRGALLVGVGTYCTLLPMAWMISVADRQVARKTVPQRFGDAMAEAFALPSYWLLVVGFFVCGFHVAFFAAHVPNYAATLGLESWVGVAALTAVGAANVVGTWLSGRWGKKHEQRIGLVAIYLGRSLVFVGFLVLPMNGPTLIVLSALLGMFWLSTVPLTSGLMATFFGTNWLATLYGIAFFSHQLGGFFGIWLAGILFDATRSYETMWWISVALGGIAALLHWPIREAPVPRLAPAKG